MQSSRVRLSLHADVAKDSFSAWLKMPKDLPYKETLRLAEQVEHAFFAVQKDTDQQLGLAGKDNQTHVSKQSVLAGLESYVWEHEVGFWTELTAYGRQHVHVEDFIREWRQRIGDLGRGRIDFIYKEGDVPYDIEFNLSTSNPADLPRVAEQLKQKLSAFPGVYDVSDSAEQGKPEIHLQLKPAAERLGISLEDLAQQTRSGYFGYEVQRLQRNGKEVKVMVRLPLSERQSLSSLRHLPILLPNGKHTQLGVLAELKWQPGYAKLVRLDRQRIIKVQARVDPNQIDVNEIYQTLIDGEINTLKQRYNGLEITQGEARLEQLDTVQTLSINALIALLVIYALIAVPFRSYSKPLIFLLVIPFSWSGAVWAHYLFDLPLSMESLVGMIAASGVVVNDSLVLMSRIKNNDASGRDIKQIIFIACRNRFRPILLAFLTTFVGILPFLLESSVQAQFLIPMALSLAAGLLFGLTASLILTPVCYYIVQEES